VKVSNRVAKIAAITAFGEVVNCGYFSLASAVHLVDEHLDQDITHLPLS
jgi:hypothetical protein